MTAELSGFDVSRFSPQSQGAGKLPAYGASRHHDVEAGHDTRIKELRCLGRQRPELDKLASRDAFTMNLRMLTAVKVTTDGSTPRCPKSYIFYPRPKGLGGSRNAASLRPEGRAETSIRSQDTAAGGGHNRGMRATRTAAAAALLLVEAGIAVLGVIVHYGLTAEYGDITDTALEGLRSGIVGVALVLVGLAALVAALVSSKLWMRLAAVVIPAVMVVGMLVVTPAALREKLEVQYDATPQCVPDEDMGPGPGSRAARESQRAFDSIKHVGQFGGGGGSGVGGCDRSFVLTEDVDVLQHYRVALAEAGWRLVEDDAHQLRAERDGMAFEVVTCDRGGVVWAGSDGAGGRVDVGAVGPADGGARCPQ